MSFNQKQSPQMRSILLPTIEVDKMEWNWTIYKNESITANSLSWMREQGSISNFFSPGLRTPVMGIGGESGTEMQDHIGDWS